MKRLKYLNRTSIIKRLYLNLVGKEISDEQLEYYDNFNKDLRLVQLAITESKDFLDTINTELSDPAPIKNDIPIFILNLKRRPDRKNNMISRFNELGISNYEFIESVDGATILPVENERNLTPSEIGCSLSHINVAKKIIKENLDYAVVLEDDAKLTLDFKDFVKNFNLKTNEFDFLLLGCHSSNVYLNGNIKVVVNAPHIIAEVGSIIYLDHPEYNIGSTTVHDFYYPSLAVDLVFGTYAYVMSNTGAKKLLELNYPVEYEADAIWNMSALKLRATKPMLAHRLLDETDIKHSARPEHRTRRLHPDHGL